MIDPGYCVTMARYNIWQNRQLDNSLRDLPDPELDRDRGAFFGSIRRTLNHLLWGDAIWMSRFDGGERPGVGIPDSVDFCTDMADWRNRRAAMDARIAGWAGGLDSAGLGEDLRWYSGALGQEVSKPLALCVAHMFNHQTHHRGQIHAMLTAAGAAAPVTDLFAMPDDIA